MIKSHFSQFGEIIDCVVPRDPRTRFAKGFAFVTYTKGKAVDEVMTNRPHQVGAIFLFYPRNFHTFSSLLKLVTLKLDNSKRDLHTQIFLDQ